MHHRHLSALFIPLPFLKKEMWTIFPVFIESVTILLLFYILVFLACGILAPQLGIEPTSPALEGEFLTAEPPEKSPDEF